MYTYQPAVSSSLSSTLSSDRREPQSRRQRPRGMLSLVREIYDNLPLAFQSGCETVFRVKAGGIMRKWLTSVITIVMTAWAAGAQRKFDESKLAHAQEMISAAIARG